MMARVEVSQRAEVDLLDIYSHSFLHFGQAQTEAYVIGLNETIEMLAEKPRIGRDFTTGRRQYRRYEYNRHTTFYQEQQDSILVIRVLHNRMDNKLHL